MADAGPEAETVARVADAVAPAEEIVAPAEEIVAPYSAALHATFNAMNRWLFVPVLRAGLAPLIDTPIGGYFVLLETTGRRSGRPRYAPLLYAIEGGCVFVAAGFGTRTHWYRNIEVDPRVRVRLPGRRPFAASAETVTEPTDRIRLQRRICQNGGLSGYLVGVDPWRATDDALARQVAGVPIVRLRPTGPDGAIVSGTFDPGGRAWLPVQSAWLAFAACLALVGRRLIRR